MSALTDPDVDYAGPIQPSHIHYYNVVETTYPQPWLAWTILACSCGDVIGRKVKLGGTDNSPKEL